MKDPIPMPYAVRLLAVLLVPVLAACAPPPPDFRAEADVVIVGEVHGTPGHHARQAQIAAELQPATIVFEQISGSQTARLNGLMRTETDPVVIARALDWDNSGWPGFGFYYDIMRAAPNAQIIGGGAARSDVRLARQQGAAEALGTQQAARFGVDLPLPPSERAAREQAQVDAHCGAIPANLAAGFVEAQRYRDAVLAQTVLLARERVNGGTVLLITGNGHARVDYGVPALLSVADPTIDVFSIGQVGPGDTTPFNDVHIGPLPSTIDLCEGFAS